ncbi:MAG: tripartite tricarboxylate transporter substrate binding protein [Chloroflexi bacterium]|nr:tripartite tricarboxylate transporter substrate binding protein [Chloroflexota bacterium]
MSRVIALVIALALVLAAAACAAAPAAPASKPAEPAAAPAPAKAAEPAKPAAQPAKPAAAAPQPAAKPAEAAWKPSKPLKFIVQYAAGGGVDVNARILSKYAEKYLGQPIVVENITGAAGATGVAAVARAAPDGHTLFFMVNPTVLDGYLRKGLPYKLDSFKPVIQATYEPNVLVVKKGGPFDVKLTDLFDKAKQNPGKLRMGVGVAWGGQDFARAILEDASGMRFARVPFDGGAPARQALIAGDVDVGILYWSETKAFYEGGQINMLAVFDEKRLPDVPNAPTLREVGLNVEHGVWRIVGVPAGTPDNVVAALHDAFKKALDDPDAKKDLEKAAIPIVYRNTADSAKLVASEDARYKALVAKLGILAQ